MRSKSPILAAALLCAACSTTQIQQAQNDIAAGVQAACTDVAAAAKINPTSPVIAYATAACPLGIAASTLVQNSATIQWLGTIQAQLAPATAAVPATPAS